jgi:hypothetical protein
VTAQLNALEYLLRLTIHSDNHLSFEKRRLLRSGKNEWWVVGGKPLHFDRLRWRVGWQGGSRGEVRRMRAHVRGPGGGWQGGGEGTLDVSSQGSHREREAVLFSINASLSTANAQGSDNSGHYDAQAARLMRRAQTALVITMLKPS